MDNGRKTVSNFFNGILGSTKSVDKEAAKILEDNLADLVGPDEPKVAATPQVGLPDHLREFDDVDKTRDLIYNNVLTSLTTKFPYSDGKHRLELHDVKYSGSQDYTWEDQKKALMTNRSLKTPVKGTWKLYDETTGALLDEKEEVVMDVPYFTQRGTFINNGSEYTIVNQSRLKPGMYTRTKQNGEHEAQFNVKPGTGRGFRVWMEPSTGVFMVNVGQANVPAYQFLKSQGVTDDQMKESWGDEVYQSNLQKSDNQALGKLYQRFAGNKVDNQLSDEEKTAYLRQAMLKAELDERVVERTTGLLKTKNVTPDLLLRTTNKLLNINRKQENPDDRDAPEFSNILSVEDFVKERIEKDAGNTVRTMLYNVRRDRNLNRVRRGALNSYMSSLLLGSGLAQCFDKETKVLTDRGFVAWPDVVAEDKFACCVNGELTYHQATKLYHSHYTGNMLGVLTRSVSYLVTPNHRCLYRHSSDAQRGIDVTNVDNYLVAEAQELHGKGRIFCVRLPDATPKTTSCEFTLKWIHGKHFEGRTQVFNINDWAEFLGWYMSEGYAIANIYQSKGKTIHSYRVTISQNKRINPAKCIRIEELLTRMGIAYRYSEQGTAYIINHKGLCEHLLPLGKSGDKYIPRYLFEHNKETLQKFFDAYIAGDGNVACNHTKACTASSKLADDLVELAARIGKPARYAVKRFKNPKWNPSYVIGFKLHACAYVKSDRLEAAAGRPSKYYTTWYDDTVYCAEVPGNKLFVLRDGVAHWSGNSIEETNPFQLMDQQNRIIKLGEGGIGSAETITDEARDVNNGQMGFIDPVAGPESDKVGIDVRASFKSFKGNDQQVYAEFLNNKGQKTYLKPEDMTGKVLAFPGQDPTKKPEATAIKDGKMVQVPWDEVNYTVPSQAHMYFGGFNLTPLPTSFQPGRAFYASKYWSQYLPLVNGEVPLVQSKVPGEEQSFAEYYGRKTGAINSKVGGVVTKVTDAGVTVTDEEGKKHYYETVKNFPFNRLTAVSFNPKVQAGDVVKPGDMIAHSNFTDKDTGAFNMGVNLKTAVVPYEAWSYEDAYVISESAAKKLESERLMGFDKANKGENIVNKNKFMSSFSKKFTKEQYDNIGDNGVAIPGTILKQGDPIILAIGPKVLGKEDEKLGKLHKALRSAFRDESVIWESKFPGVVTDIGVTSSGVKVNVKTSSPAQIGDKLSNLSASKGVIGQIVKDEEMPIDQATNEPYEMLLNPMVVLSRVAPNQLAEMQLAKIAKKNGKPYVLPSEPPEEGWTAFTKAELDKNGMTAQNTIYDPVKGREIKNLGEGYMYLSAFHHLAEKKLSGRDMVGGYTCYDEKTEVLTFTGWKKWRDVTETDLLATSDKETLQELRFEKPLNLVAENFSGDMCRIKGRYLDALVTPNHSMIVLDSYGKITTVEAKELVGTSVLSTSIPQRVPGSSVVALLTKPSADIIIDGIVVYEPYTGKVYCATMSTGVLYVRRNGKPLICGNSNAQPAKGGKTGAKRFCFPYAQQVWTEHGEMAIGHIVHNKLNVRVYAPDESGKWGLHKVTNWFKRQGAAEELMTITVAPAADGNVAFRRDLYPTKGHEVYLHNGTKVKASQLSVGDLLTTYSIVDGSLVSVPAYVVAIEKASNDLSAINLYDIEVADVHRYCASNIVVSNSLMDINALLSHGATEVIKDAHLIRGTKNENYWNTLRAGRPLPEPETPFIYDKFMNTLKAGGINVRKEGDILTIMPMTNADIDKLSAGEVKNSRTVDIKNQDAAPGGLFDMASTGGAGGKKWSHVTLAEPLPNPVMEEPIRRVLGLTVKQFHDVLTGREQLNGAIGGKALRQALGAIDVDKEIDRYTNEIKTTRGARRDNAIKALRYLNAARQQSISPTDWIIDKVPIIPPAFRPISNVGDMLKAADLNGLYRDVIETNNSIKELRNDIPDSELADEKLNLYKSVTAAFGLGEPITPDGVSKRWKGAIRQVIGTNPKCYDDATDILTENGWVPFPEYVDTRLQVATLNPATDTLEFQNPSSILHEPYSGEMVHTNTRSIDLLVTAGHWHYVELQDPTSKATKWLPAKKVQAGDLARGIAKQAKYFIGAANFIGSDFTYTFNGVTIPQDALAEFLGWYLRRGRSTKEFVVGLARNSDAADVDAMDAAVQMLGLPYRRKLHTVTSDRKIVRWEILSPEFGIWVTFNFGQHPRDLSIPNDVSFWHKEHQLHLLATYFGDPTRLPSKVMWTTTSKGLVDSIELLCTRIGYTFKASVIVPGVQWRCIIRKGVKETVSYGFQTTIVPNWEGMVHCVTVPNGLIFVRRNGKVSVSGNTGMFQSNVLSKTVDSVGRGVVVPNPTLDMDTVGIPEAKAWTIYRPFLIREMVRRGIPQVKATELIDNKDKEAREVLEAEMEKRPVILDRAPTWHKFNLLAFKPVLTDTDTIQVSPLITSGFNMDFDGNCCIGSTYVNLQLDKNVCDVTTNEWYCELVNNLGKAPSIPGTCEAVTLTTTIGKLPKVGTPKKDRNGADVYAIPPGVAILSYNHETGKPVYRTISHFTVEAGCNLVEVTTTTKSVKVSSNESLAIFDHVTGGLVKASPVGNVGMSVPVLVRPPHQVGKVPNQAKRRHATTPLTDVEVEVVKPLLKSKSLRTQLSSKRLTTYALKRVLATLSKEELTGLEALYDRAFNTEVRWDIITDVKPIPTETVYDVEVEGTKVFEVNNGLIIWDTANFHVPVSDKAVQQAWEKMTPSKNLFAINDLKTPQHTPSKEMVMGLYQLTRKPSNKKPIVFTSIQEAKKAYREGLIDANDPIEIRE